MNATCFTFPSTDPGQAAWVADPSCRGTFNIALSCLSTTFICIWSSVHKDIPFQPLSTFRSLRRDAPLVLVALFAPELMLYFALNQYICARSVFRFASELESFKVQSNEEKYVSSKFRRLLHFFGLRRDTPSGPESDVELLINREATTSTSQLGRIVRQNRFTFVHGFYAAMGGFTFIQPRGFFVEEPKQVKLTVAGVKFFMKYEPDLIPDLSLTSITDRQKSNSLGKTLLVVQVFWFCLSCVSRLAERLPLSLLEVSTLAHGLFTLSSYAMWWSKPLSVDVPTWISMDGEHARDAYALVFIASRGYFRKSDEYEQLKAALVSNSPPPTRKPILKAAWNAVERYGISPEDLSTIRDTFFIPMSIKSVPELSDLFNARGFATLSNYVLQEGTDYVVTTCIPLVYGFLHLLALRAQFPTSIERELWRIASVVVMSSGAFGALVDFIVDICLHGLGVSGSLGQAIGRSRRIAYNYILPFFYLLASGYLLVESIRQLWYLPHDAYVVASWSYYIPHWL
ncbi:hypothetical protein SCHPADRAFT_939836 [Schizopora paradoxa]|uniref:Uncharacterized protein n=1 Tax=Schizopora paradoxa TaxID=27342 RepID=A0A0H2RX90_9AGAM|nr:hypothetical protein SCHPADRAFT_939836 [Schizopora paradoxa]